MSAVRARWRSQDGGARGQDRGDGRKAGGGPPPSDRVNLTDEESRIMPVTCGRFGQIYNARAAVVTGSPMVGERLGARPSDRTRSNRCRRSKTRPRRWAKAENLLADNGHFSAANVEACAKAGVEPTIVMECPDFSSFYTQIRSSLGSQMTIRQRACLHVPMSSRRTDGETRYSRYQNSPLLRHTATRKPQCPPISTHTFM
jgi:hypothetical protein